VGIAGRGCRRPTFDTELPVDKATHVAARATVMQQKTQRPVQFEITEQTRESIEA
jgi:hypothetical protein